MQTVASVLQEGRQRLAEASDSPDLDSERILLYVLGKNEASWLYAHLNYLLSPEQYQEVSNYLSQRRDGKPLAYIMCSAEFYGRTFLVNEHVLIPRPETEQLIQRALQFAQKHVNISTIADVGTGSGCIAITLALELPHVRIVATDISRAALSVAQENARGLGVFDRIEFVQGSLLEPLLGRPVDLIVSNPPYVPTGELERATEQSDTLGLMFEPAVALDGGLDGQKCTREIKKAGVPYIMEVTGGLIEHVTSVPTR